MSRFNTGNPLGSGDPRDLDDNAKNMDLAMNSDDPTWVDRLGRDRKSFEGMEREFDADQASRDNAFESAQTYRENEFDSAQAYRDNAFESAQYSREARFNDFISASGYQFLGDYAPGIEITEYNQLVRDENGEFWRVSGQVDLPYVTTGSGLPEGDALVPVGDAVLRQQLAQDNGYRLVANQMAPNAYGVPGKLENVTTSTVTISPCGYFDDLLWGRDSSRRLHSSSDMGATWSLVSSAANRVPLQAFRTADGEVLVQSSDGLSKSSGWAINPATATWTTVLSRPAGNVADFLKWGTDGDGQKFIATHYSSTRADSRYVWISTDAGDTFTQVYDSNVNDPVEGPLSHIHAACYDPWADRFYFTEGHEGVVGIYYSDDDGANWTKMTADTVNGSTMEPAFTTMTATDFGIVCGTDTAPNGVWLIRRTADPDDAGIEFMGSVTKAREGVAGFFDHSFRDPDTGIVYLGFNSNFYPQVPHAIMACGAAGASIIYSGSSGRVFSVFAAKGRIVAQLGAGSTWLRADTSKGSFFGDYLIAQDRGNIGLSSGEYTRAWSLRVGREASARGLESTAVGLGASANSAQFGVAVGRLASASSGESATALGYSSDATGPRSLAIGATASTTSAWTLAIGYGTSSTGTGGVSIGYLASANQGIAIGRSAQSSGSPASIAIGEGATAVGGIAAGQNANASGASSSALGNASSATTTGANAFGYAAAATGVDSTAVGRSAAASSTDSVAVGCSASAAYQATAVGRGATAIANSMALGRVASGAHSGGVAIGNNTATQRDNSVCVGNRHIESTLSGGRIYLKSPDGTLRYISINNAGEITVTTV